MNQKFIHWQSNRDKNATKTPIFMITGPVRYRVLSLPVWRARSIDRSPQHIAQYHMLKHKQFIFILYANQ